MGSKHFTISQEQRYEYVAGFILDLMINQGAIFNVVLEGADRDLEPLFIHMMAQDYVDLDKKQNYAPTVKGIEKLNNLKKKYEEYLAHFDIFCAVDLEKGIFAFAKIFDLDDAEWEEYLHEERFVDLRIAVAWYKNISPSDFVFLSFLKEGQFNTDQENWQFDLLSGLTWQQIGEIVNSAIQIEELGYEAENGEWISGEAVIEDIISQGAELNIQLHQREETLRHQTQTLPNDYSDEEDEPYVVSNYDCYINPGFVSPVWFLF